ncbi:MAG: hypothetical protein MUP63_00965 [Candidatus Nanohaloarchaeota archaeon QJJ-7]|nr:hypothetical protein [Candidatus Nanohaloarchaeota archaeon QJJ-7]
MGLSLSYRRLSILLAGLVVLSSAPLGYWMMTDGTVLQKIFGISITISALFLAIHYHSLVETRVVNG